MEPGLVVILLAITFHFGYFIGREKRDADFYRKNRRRS